MPNNSSFHWNLEHICAKHRLHFAASTTATYMRQERAQQGRRDFMLASALNLLSIGPNQSARRTALASKELVSELEPTSHLYRIADECPSQRLAQTTRVQGFTAPFRNFLKHMTFYHTIYNSNVCRV